jgi:hypothetical protein
VGLSPHLWRATSLPARLNLRPGVGSETPVSASKSEYTAKEASPAPARSSRWLVRRGKAGDPCRATDLGDRSSYYLRALEGIALLEDPLLTTIWRHVHVLADRSLPERADTEDYRANDAASDAD